MGGPGPSSQKVRPEVDPESKAIRGYHASMELSSTVNPSSAGFARGRWSTLTPNDLPLVVGKPKVARYVAKVASGVYTMGG